MNNDLIDRTALLRKWGEKFFSMGGDRLGPNGDEIMWYLNSLLDEIKNAPTIDLEEVKYKAFCEGVDKMKEAMMKGNAE